MATKAASDIADSIRRFARQYQDMLEAAALLDQYGSLENAIAEAKAALVAAQKDRDAGIAEKNKVMLDLKTASANHATMLANTSTEAIRLKEVAKTTASDLTAQAQTQANQLIADAKRQAETEKTAVANDVIALKITKSALKDETEALKTEIAAMHAESDAAEKRLAKVKADIAKLATA